MMLRPELAAEIEQPAHRHRLIELLAEKPERGGAALHRRERCCGFGLRVGEGGGLEQRDLSVARLRLHRQRRGAAVQNSVSSTSFGILPAMLAAQAPTASMRSIA
jgi:hypothetical protein